MTEDLRNSIISELRCNNICAQASDNHILIQTTIENIDLELRCEFNEAFPYEFPSIYLNGDSRDKIPAMPHINTDGSICIFDEGVAVANFMQPEKLACETIQKAISIIQHGVRKENSWDFLDEFNAYWSTKAIFQANCFIENLTESQSISFCFQERKGSSILIAKSVKQLTELYKRISLQDLIPSKIYTGLLIPVDKDLDCEIPKTDIDIIRLIEKHSSFAKVYNRFMQQHINSPVLLLFAQQTVKGIILSGWLHWGPGIPKGFRRGHVNLIAAFAQSSNRGIAISVENCSQNRLFDRGGDGKRTYWNKVALIGCGSLGSMLADSLSYTGTSEYLLVDNQVLRYENIARHTRGYCFESFSKTNAVEFGLEKHNPNIHCSCFNENAHLFLENHVDDLNSCDAIFVSVASFAVEHHICEMVNAGTITVPVIILWVEPYALGGHAILINKHQNLFEEMFDPTTLEFQFPLVADSTSLLKREAGCQSTYMPYSGFYLQMFVLSVLEKLSHEGISNKRNYLFTWSGRLSSANEYGVQLTPLASSLGDFTWMERRID